MAGNDTAALVVAMSAQLTKFEKDLDNAYGLADKATRRIEHRFSAMNLGGEAVSQLTRRLGELATVAGVVELTRQMIDLNEQVARIADVSERIGLSTDEFQSLRYAIVATGGSAQTAEAFMDRFSNAVSNAAKGQGDLYNFFRVNNVALKDQNGQLLPANVLLGKYADLVKNTKSPQDRLNEAMMVGGRQAGPELVSVLQQGSAGLQRFADEARNAGVVLDKDVIEQAKRTNEEFQKLKLQFQTGAEAIAVGTFDLLARSIGSVAGGLEEVIKNLGILEKFKGAPGQYDFSGGFNGGVGYVPGGSVSRVTIDVPKGAPRRSEVASPLANGAVDDCFKAAPGDGAGTTKQYNAQADAFQKLIQAQEQRIQLLAAEQAGIGKTVGEQTYLTEKIKLETQAKAENIPLTASRLAKIDEEARKLGAAAQALDDYKRHWQGAQDAAKFFGNELESQLSNIDASTKGIDLVRSAVKDLTNELIKAAVTGEGAFAKILGLAPTAAGGVGGIFGGLAHIFGFDAGGYTGAGGRLQPAGVVHKGEIVFSQDDIRRLGGVNVVEALRRGYADGGIVGAGDIAPANVRGGGSGSMVFAPVTQIDARGSNMTEDQFRSIVAANNQTLRRQWQSDFGSGLTRMQKFGHV